MKKIVVLLTVISLFLLSSVSLVYGTSNTEGGQSVFSITNVEVISSNGQSNQTLPSINALDAVFGSLGRRDSFAKSGEHITMNVLVSTATSVITSVSLEFTTPNGIEMINAVEITGERWEITRVFADGDIGTWKLDKIIAYDTLGNACNKTFNDFKFYILPSKYEQFSNQILTINTDNDLIMVSFSKELDETTVNNQSILLYESNNLMSFPIIEMSDLIYNLKQLTDYNLTVSTDKKSFTVENNSSYQSSKRYHIIIKDTLKDLEGNVLTNPKWINLKYVSS